MDKRTVLAVVLSVAVFWVYTTFFVPEPVKTEEKAPVSTEETVEIKEKKEVVKPGNFTVDTAKNISREKIIIDTDLIIAELDSKGAVLSSYKIKNQKVSHDSEELVDLVYNGETEKGYFSMALGDKNSRIFDENFEINRIDEYNVEFTRDIMLHSQAVRLVKTYSFKPGEYLFEVKISMQSSTGEALSLSDTAYSLKVGPQLGPEFEKYDPGAKIFRTFSVYTDGEIDDPKVKDGGSRFVDDYKWAGINSKYFVSAIIPEGQKPSLYFDALEMNKGVSNSANIYFERSGTTSSVLEDVYKVYLGPKEKAILAQYEEAENNSWSVSGLDLVEYANQNLWFLEVFFKFILEFLYSFVGNYGVAIVLFTVAVKLIMYPFTRKSFDSMGKMQAIQPEIKKIQEKYKNDSAKMNAAMAELYKREGVNPIGGCLPMLLQMPVFIAMYGLIDEFFALRGAGFIPGWIDDLSQPEMIFNLGFTIPLLNWSAIRLLPIIYLTTQLVTMKFTQSPSAAAGGASNAQTKMLTLGMPIMFFFILYNRPSGLLVYWITMNLIQGIQQFISKKRNAKEGKS